MNSPNASVAGAPAPRARIARGLGCALAAGGLALAALVTIDDPLVARAAAIAAVYLVLLLAEMVPPFVPTLLLLTAAPLLLAPLDDRYRLGQVLTWPADPVLALFAGALALGLAAQRHGIDARIAATIVRLSRGRRRALLALVLAGTAMMSMWMSNIAAAAMMLAALRPLLRPPAIDGDARRALLLAIAIGANLGGMATPVGTGPNAIAIAAAAPAATITFLGWMAFALPLVVAMLALTFVLLVRRYRVAGRFDAAAPPSPPLTRPALGVMVVFGLAVLGWLSEPVHGIPAPLVALATATALFGTGLLGADDLRDFDWSTLGLIAGGVSLGRLIESSGALTSLAAVEWTALPPIAWLGVLVLASALLSALMSNTATAAMLIPLALSIDPSPSTAVLVAIAASFGMPFVVSTPPNAMVYGEGGLRSRDLLAVGLTVMVVGCVTIAVTGRWALELLGVP